MLSKVLYQAAILDYNIDLQTYLKCQLSIYYQDANPIPLSKQGKPSASNHKNSKGKSETVEIN